MEWFDGFSVSVFWLVVGIMTLAAWISFMACCHHLREIVSALKDIRDWMRETDLEDNCPQCGRPFSPNPSEQQPPQEPMQKRRADDDPSEHGRQPD